MKALKRLIISSSSAPGNRRYSHSKAALARDDVERRAAFDGAHVNRRVGRFEAAVRFGRARLHFRRPRPPRKAISSAAVMTALTPRWVALEWASWPVTTVSNEIDALVGVGHMHARRFTDDDDARLDAGRRDAHDHAVDAEAADLFVVGLSARWTGAARPQALERRRQGEGDGDESSSCPRCRGRRGGRPVPDHRERICCPTAWPSTGTTSVWPDSTTPPGSSRPQAGEQVGLGAHGRRACGSRRCHGRRDSLRRSR